MFLDYTGIKLEICNRKTSRKIPKDLEIKNISK